jgi:hypothetical protein
MFLEDISEVRRAILKINETICQKKSQEFVDKKGP